MKEEIVTIPALYLCPHCREHAEGYTHYIAERERWDQEDRLRSGKASTPERIKAAWELHGKGRTWPANHGYQVSIPEPTYLSTSYQVSEPLAALTFTTFDFTREVVRNKDFTVTRVSCGGLTVEESVEVTDGSRH